MTSLVHFTRVSPLLVAKELCPISRCLASQELPMWNFGTAIGEIRVWSWGTSKESVRYRKRERERGDCLSYFREKHTLYEKLVMQLKDLAKYPRGGLTCLSNRRLLSYCSQGRHSFVKGLSNWMSAPSAYLRRSSFPRNSSSLLKACLESDLTLISQGKKKISPLIWKWT